MHGLSRLIMVMVTLLGMHTLKTYMLDLVRQSPKVRLLVRWVLLVVLLVLTYTLRLEKVVHMVHRLILCIMLIGRI